MFGIRELSGNDYGRYLRQGITEAAYWEGRGAELLDLAGKEATDLGMRRALSGDHPESGDRLRPRKISEKRNAAGELVGVRRTMYDCVLSPPKSYSVMRLWDPRLEAAHREGVRYLASEMQAVAQARVRKNGADENRHTGVLLWSRWEHETSRALDPMRHTHLAVVNLTYDPVEGRWKALQAGPLFERSKQWGEYYRYIVAGEVERLGYQLRDREKPGGGWEIARVPESALVLYSQRSAERDRAIEGFREWHEREPTSREVGILVRNHRPEKVDLTDWEEWREGQQKRLSAAELGVILALREQALERSYTVDMTKLGQAVDTAGIDTGRREAARRFAFTDSVSSEAAAQWKRKQNEEEGPRYHL